ncbi:YqkE family protein [Paenibacillus sp. 1P07SE]|uniref:YqkE family protein n=1 Tax=Paenibacillus sp. 1P07SE TaxID=3132209 RepID=UPI0039A6523A
MVRRRKPAPQQGQSAADGAATLKDLLHPEVARKLKEQSEAWQAEQAEAKAAKRRQAEQERLDREKLLEQDFEHLLNNSKQDWRNFK